VRSAVALVVLAACGRVGFDLQDGAAADSAAIPCPAFATFCDGFESGDTSHWTAPVTQASGTLTVVTSPVHGGGFALHATMPAGVPSGSEADVLHTLPLTTSGMLAVRQWVYQPQPLIAFDATLLILNSSALHYINVNGGDSGAWTVTENSASSGNADHPSANVIPLDTWICVELDVDVRPLGPFTLYIDDVNVLTGNVGDPAPAYDSLHAGVARADSGGSETIVDDVVIAAQHIGCN